MKKTFIYIAVICAAMFAGDSCEKIEQPQPQSPVDNSEIQEKEGTYSVTFECSMAEDDATRTEFHDNGIWWSVGDNINFYQRRYINETELKVGTSEQTVTETDNRDKFSCEITNFIDPSRYPVYYWALFPAESVKTPRTYFTGDEVAVYYAKMNVPAEQSPSADSFDPKADVLVSKYITSNVKQTNFNLQFRRVVALGKMTIKNLQSENAIKSIKFENYESDLAGQGYYELEGTGTRNTVASQTGRKYITVNYTTESQVKANTPTGMTAYFTCRAFTLDKGEKFKVTVTTYADEVFTKEVTIPETLTNGLIFEEGRATKFTVDMSTTKSSIVTVASDNSIPCYTTNFDDALTYAKSNSTEDKAITIKLLSNYTLSSNFTINAAANNIILDLNGKQLNISNDYRPKIGAGKLTIKDSGTAGTIKVSDSDDKCNAVWVYNGGTVVMESGAIESTGGYTVSVQGGNLEFIDGYLCSNKSSCISVSDYSENGGIAKINGGVFTSKAKYVIYCNGDNSQITISDGSFKNEYDGTDQTTGAVLYTSKGSIIVNDGYYYTCTTADNPLCFKCGTTNATISITKAYFNTDFTSGCRDPEKTNYNSCNIDHTHGSESLHYTRKVTPK